MAHGRLEKVDIKNEADGNRKIKREFHLPKKYYNEIVDICIDQGETFSHWVMDAVRRKLSENRKE